MTKAEIWQIVLSFFSVIATVLIALVIYWLQKRHEKEIEKLNKKQYEEKVELEARTFLINNAKEIEFLPLCIFSANLNKNVNHKRKIYTNFNLNYADIQKEILRQAGFVEKLINENDCWITSAMDNLYKFMRKRDCTGDNLFINVHYLNEYFKLYKHLELNEYTYQIEKEIIMFFEKNIINNEKIDLPPYLSVIDFKEKYTYEQFLSSLFFIKYASVLSYNTTHLLTDSSLEKTIDQIRLERVEDLYYETLYWLYFVFYKKEIL